MEAEESASETQRIVAEKLRIHKEFWSQLTLWVNLPISDPQRFFQQDQAVRGETRLFFRSMSLEEMGPVLIWQRGGGEVRNTKRVIV